MGRLFAVWNAPLHCHIGAPAILHFRPICTIISCPNQQLHHFGSEVSTGVFVYVYVLVCVRAGERGREGEKKREVRPISTTSSDLPIPPQNVSRSEPVIVFDDMPSDGHNKCSVTQDNHV